NRSKHTATRSQNSFIIFRKDFQARLIAEQGPEIGAHLKDISRRASLFWRECSPEDKYMYDRIAACTKKLHGKNSTRYHHKPMKPGRCGTEYRDNEMGRKQNSQNSSPLPFTNHVSHANSTNSIHGHLNNDKLPPNNYYHSYITNFQFFKQGVASHNPKLFNNQLQINSLSSYDKSLISSVDKNTRI
ncbi:2845_t:CDS:1, partial [Acaulospora morrowiae]